MRLRSVSPNPDRTWREVEVRDRLHREYGAPARAAGAEILQRRLCFAKGSLGHRDRHACAAAHQRQKLFGLRERPRQRPFDRHRAQRKHRDGGRVAAAEEAGDHDLATLGERADGKPERSLRADEIANAVDAAGRRQHGFARTGIGGIECSGGARGERSIALARIDVRYDRRGHIHGAGEPEPHRAAAAEPDQQQGAARGTVGEPLERGIGGEPRAHQGAAERWRQRRVIEEVTRVGDDDVARIAAIYHDAEMSRLGAEILVAVTARRANATTDPGIDGDPAPRRDVGLRTRRLDHAGDLVAEGERQRTAGADVELLVGGELEEAVLDMQVRMADAAPLDAHQHFAALRLRAIDHGLAQGGALGNERLAAQLGHPGFPSAAPSCDVATAASSALARATNFSIEISSARTAPSMSAAARSGVGSTPRARQVWRSILRRWPKAAAVTRSSVDRVHGSGAARGINRTTDDVTLGGGTKADGATSNMIFASVRQPARTARRPYGFSPGFATMRSATSR